MFNENVKTLKLSRLSASLKSDSVCHRKCLLIASKFNGNNKKMLNDSELATLRNRFKRDAEFLMRAADPGVEDEKSKLQKTPAG